MPHKTLDISIFFLFFLFLLAGFLVDLLVAVLFEVLLLSKWKIKILEKLLLDKKIENEKWFENILKISLKVLSFQII